MKKVMVLLIAVAFILAAASAYAATVTSNFNVTATASGSCRITTAASDVNFGTYDPTNPSPDDDGIGSAGFRCTKGSTYWTYITGTRQMTGGAETLNFELYSDAGRTTVYPSSKTGPGTTSPSNAEIISNYYGRIPALQDVTQGNVFSATLTFTVEY
ncbi:MAG: spore coat protein U domain-containing protein [Nitrospira sp.]|nr:spore coat protein U domain-containing protein [Nitrospira sp.]